ncbi:hypothetical protein BD779DRAFT_1672888 [Infundibulicybe gibba]|nr:hypothetical protein BD779DRAFT_1672888 [Infundibulicybe gibba]
MALVCRHFFNAPMDCLWHEVPDLLYVLRCLPSDVWKAPLTYYGIESAVLARAIAPIDLERFRTLYAHRVQVSQRSIVQPEVPADVYQALSFAFQGQPIFPNLVELGQTGPGGFSHYISMLLGPRIRKIALSLDGPAQTSLLPMLGEKYPALIQFTLHADYNPDIGRWMNHILPEWTQLQSLTVPHLPEESLRVVAGLPHLLDLVLSRANSNFGDTFSPIFGQPVFPVLRKLFVRADTPTLCVNLLRAATNCPLEEFIFHLAEAFTPLDWHDLFSALAESCDKATLTRIHAGDIETLGEQLEAPPAETTDQLRPLLLFTNLTYVNLGTCYGFGIGDTFIREMAIAWPHLQYLDIGTIGMSQELTEQQPQLTLQGLAPLVEFCPDLVDLTIDVNATHFCFNHVSLGSSPSNSRVQFLDVHHSSIGQSSVAWVAAYLSRTFPRLRSIDWDSGSEEDEERLAYPKRWQEVMNYLVACRHMRGHQRDDLCCVTCDGG